MEKQILSIYLETSNEKISVEIPKVVLNRKTALLEESHILRVARRFVAMKTKDKKLQR